jgi:hypothetical protein
MKNKELMALIVESDPEAEVLVAVNGEPTKIDRVVLTSDLIVIAAKMPENAVSSSEAR